MTRDVLQQAARLAGTREALRLSAEKVAHSYLRGPHGRRRVGQGERFWQFRAYQAGDMPRDIDWRQSGKRDDVFVREREHEAAQTLWVYRDASASMQFSSGKYPPKRDYAETLVLAAALLALEAGERVGSLGADRRAHSHVNALPQLQELLDAAPSVGAALVPPVSRAIVLVASDFYTEIANTDALCAAVAARQGHPVLLQVCDPAEETMPYRGRVRFEEIEAPEGVEAMLVDDVRGLRDAYLEKFAAHRRLLDDTARRYGGALVCVNTGDDPAAALGRVLAAIGAER